MLPKPSGDYPYKDQLIPICQNVIQLKQFLAAHPDFDFCVYLADKDAGSWQISTSRRYMNQVLPRFLYVPVNIPRNDIGQLSSLIDMATYDHRIAAINITQPHKNSPIFRREFFGDENSTLPIDTLIKDTTGILQPRDLNAPAFVCWFEQEIGTFNDRQVVVIGVGGTGEPIACQIAVRHPRSLFLVDPIDKSRLALRLSPHTDVAYVASLAPLSFTPTNLMMINASGKEGISDDLDIAYTLGMYRDTGSIFIDIRPHIELPLVNQARQLGWQAYTGSGMNTRNDYALITEIALYLNIEPPTFPIVQQLIMAAS